MSVKDLWMGTAEGFQVHCENMVKLNGMTLEDMVKCTELAKANGYLSYHDDDGEDEDDPRVFNDQEYMMDLVGSVAVIHIQGTLTNEYSPWNKYYGEVSYDEIRASVVEAVNHAGVESILLNIDSPGGSVSGINELSTFITKVDAEFKPVYSATGGQMASGGYWLGSIGRQIYATELSSVGSIGVIAIHQERTKMLEEIGIKTTVIREGKFKALGNPYEKLTDEAKAKIQSELATVYDVFTRTVAQNRGVTQDFIKANAAEGEVFLGKRAQEVGLVDIIGSFDEAVAAITRLSDNQLSINNNPNEGVEDMAKKATLTVKGQAALAAGASMEQVVSESGNTVEVEDTSVDKKVEGDKKPDVKVEGDKKPDVKVEGDKKPDVKVEGEEVTPAAEVVVDPAVALLTTQLAVSLEATVDLKVEVKTLLAKVASSDAAIKSLQEVVVQATMRLQIATGAMASDLSVLDPVTLVAQFNSLQAALEERFPVGAQADVKVDDKKSTDVVVDHTAAAQHNATKIGKKAG